MNYFDNPLKYAQSLLEEFDSLYTDSINTKIAEAKDHYLLTSSHLESRAAIPGRSAHYFPELHPAIRARVAYIFDTMTSGQPPIKLSPQDSDIPGIVDSVARLEDYINDCHTSGHLWESWYNAWINADLFPFAAIYADWEDRWGRAPQLDQRTGRLAYDNVITFSGPRLVTIQPEDHRCDLYARSQDEIRGHFFFKDVSEGYIKQRGQGGAYNQYDPGMLYKAKAGEHFKRRAGARFNERYQKPSGYDCELIVGFVKVFNEDEGIEEIRQITYAGDMLLDEKKFAYSELGMPIRLISSEVLPGEIAALSTSILGGSTQNMINELYNQVIEANEQSIFSPVLFKGGINSKAIWEPQALWEVEYPESFTPLVKPNTSFLNVDMIRFLEERNQQNLASYDTMQPVMSKSKQTLGEYMGKKESHNKIMGVNMHFYANAVVDMVIFMLGMARDRLPDWIELQLFGNNRILERLTMADLANNVTVDIPKVRALANEELQMVKWDVLYDKLMANPLIAMNPMFIHNLTKRYLEAHNEKNIEELIGQAAPAPMMMAGAPPQIPYAGGMNAR